jgi:hypothetical protein
MNLSSNSLFHFTDSIENVKSILADKIYGSYCKETLHYKADAITLIIPMICFCDIPLKTISQYTKYGRYGIGLKKGWGIKNQLNPVLYLEKSSRVADSLIKSLRCSLTTIAVNSPKIDELMKKYHQVEANQNMTAGHKMLEYLRINLELKKYSDMNAPMEHIIYSLYYTKHYADDLERNGEVTKGYRFYDEREWRYLPDFTCAVCELRRTEEEYNNWRGNSKQKPILKEVNLTFLFEEIDQIIVAEEKEVKEIREMIKSIPNCSDPQKEELYSKILSFEKIMDM